MTLLPLPLTLPSADMALAWLPVAVCMVDAEGHFRYVNDAFERIFGYSQAEALGMPMLLLVHPDDRAATLDAVQAQAESRDRHAGLQAIFSRLMENAVLTPLFNYQYQISAPPGVNGIRLNTRGWFDFTEAWLPAPKS